MQREGARGIQRILNRIQGYVYDTLYAHYIACVLFVARTLSRFPKISYETVMLDFSAEGIIAKSSPMKTAKS